MSYQRVTRSSALALALAALAVPTAVAQEQDLRSPDARDVVITSAPAQDLRSPDARDALRPATTQQPVSAPAQVVERPVDAGFQWGDAGIGAAGMLVLALLGLGLGLRVGPRRHAARAAAGAH
jgi:hypothetical protein